MNPISEAIRLYSSSPRPNAHRVALALVLAASVVVMLVMWVVAL